MDPSLTINKIRRKRQHHIRPRFTCTTTMTTDVKKTVRFETSAPIVYEASQRKGKSSSWLRKEEYTDIHLQEKYIIQQVRIGVFVEGDEDSFRGLETRMKRGKKHLAGVQEVFLEQKKQTSLGCHNEQAIANIYAQCTREAARLAYNMARKDARIAAAIHEETSFKRTSRKPPFGILKKAISFSESLAPPRMFRRRQSLETLSSSKAISLASSPETVTAKDTQVLSNLDTPTTSASNMGEQPVIVKTVNIPSRIPFVGEPAQLLSSPKRNIQYRSLNKPRSPIFHETTQHHGDRLRKRPSLDVLLRSNNVNAKIQDADRSAYTVSSNESTSGFLMKPMCTRVRL